MVSSVFKGWRGGLCFLAGWMFCAGLGVGVGQAGGGVPGGAPQESKPIAFETVSVRLNKAPMGPETTRFEFAGKGDGLVIRDMVLSSIVGTFYGFFQDAQTGMPEWADQECYDILAKVADSDLAAYHRLNEEQRNRMVQAVLEERFGLRVHHAQKDGSIYELVVAKSGAKVKEAVAGESYTAGPKDSEGRFRSGTLYVGGAGESIGHAASMAMLAGSLQSLAGREVVDRTGLGGRYDFVFKWNPADAESISLFTALEEQLGLRLEPAKGMVKTVVIDHVERPSGN